VFETFFGGNTGTKKIKQHNSRYYYLITPRCLVTTRFNWLQHVLNRLRSLLGWSRDRRYSHGRLPALKTKAPRDALCTRPWTNSRARKILRGTFLCVLVQDCALIRTQPMDSAGYCGTTCNFLIWVFTSGMSSCFLSEAGFDPEAFVLKAGSLPCELRFVITARQETGGNTGTN
jgi:hypothetical protein